MQSWGGTESPRPPALQGPAVGEAPPSHREKQWLHQKNHKIKVTKVIKSYCDYDSIFETEEKDLSYAHKQIKILDHVDAYQW